MIKRKATFKEFECIECGRKIRKGDFYFSVNHGWGNGYYDKKSCITKRADKLYKERYEKVV